MSGNAYDLNNKLFVIPQDEENRTSILNIDRNTKEDMRLLYRCIFDYDWECNTIANAYMETIIRTLGIHVKNTGSANAAIDMYDLFEAYVTIKHNEDAEKEGNINIAFNPGKGIDALITDTTAREDRVLEYADMTVRFSFMNDKMKTAAYEKMDKATRSELNEKYGILIPKTWMVTAVAYTFFENMIRELLYKIAMSNKPSASINFNDNIELHAVRKDTGIVITLRPGMNAKLLIKSDETTETEEDSLEEED